MCHVQSVVDEVGKIKETILNLESYKFYEGAVYSCFPWLKATITNNY